MVLYNKQNEDKLFEDVSIFKENIAFKESINNIPIYNENGMYYVNYSDYNEVCDINLLAESNDTNPNNISVLIRDYEIFQNPFILKEGYNLLIKSISTLDNIYLSLEALAEEYINTGDEYILENFEYLDEQTLSLLEVTLAQYMANKDKRVTATKGTTQQLRNIDKADNPNAYIRRGAVTKQERPVEYDKDYGMVKVNNTKMTLDTIDKEMKVGRELGGLGKEYKQNLRVARKLAKKKQAEQAAKLAIERSKNSSETSKPLVKPISTESNKDNSNSYSNTNIRRNRTTIKQKPDEINNDSNKSQSKFKKYLGLTKDAIKDSLETAKNNKGKTAAYLGGAFVGGALLTKKLSSLIRMRRYYQSQMAQANASKRNLLQRLIDKIKRIIERIKMKLSRNRG